jgi:hypothetical protein
MATGPLLLLRLGQLPNLRVGPTNFRKIQQGMSEGEVEKVLGSPTKVEDVSRYSVTVMVPTPEGARGFRLMKRNSWVGMDRVIVVDFGEKGKVEWSSLRPLEEWMRVYCHLDTRSLSEMLRDWLIKELDE